MSDGTWRGGDPAHCHFVDLIVPVPGGAVEWCSCFASRWAPKRDEDAMPVDDDERWLPGWSPESTDAVDDLPFD